MAMLPIRTDKLFEADLVHSGQEFILRLPASVGLYIKYAANYLFVLVLSIYIALMAHSGASSPKYSNQGLYIVGYGLLAYSVISMSILAAKYAMSGSFRLILVPQDDGQNSIKDPAGGNQLEIYSTRLNLSVANWVKVHRDTPALCIVNGLKTIVVIAVGENEVRNMVKKFGAARISVQTVSETKLRVRDFMTPA